MSGPHVKCCGDLETSCTDVLLYFVIAEIMEWTDRRE